MLWRNCAFGKTVKKCSINSTPQAAQKPHTGVTGWGHVWEPHAGGMQVARSDLYLQMDGVITVQTLWVKRRYQLVVRLKAIKCYKKLLCYLSSSTSGLLFIVVTALFVAILLGLQKVKKLRHSPWNPSSLRQITWQSLKELIFYSLRLMYQIGQGDFSTFWQFTDELFAKQSIKQVRETFLPSDTLWLSYLLSGVPNRLGGLFYPLILLRFNSNQSTKQVRKNYSTFWHFYGLACYAKHQTGQEKVFYPLTLLRFSCLLCKTPNRLRGTFLPSDTFTVKLFTFSS